MHKRLNSDMLPMSMLVPVIDHHNPGVQSEIPCLTPEFIQGSMPYDLTHEFIHGMMVPL